MSAWSTICMTWLVWTSVQWECRHFLFCKIYVVSEIYHFSNCLVTSDMGLPLSTFGMEVCMNANVSVFRSSCKLQISVCKVWVNPGLHVRRRLGSMNVAQPLIFIQCTRPDFPQIHTQVFLGSGYAEDCVSWGWSVWMWAGGGECWQVNFTGQHSFCIFGQPAQGSRYTGNPVAARFTTRNSLFYLWEVIEYNQKWSGVVCRLTLSRSSDSRCHQLL